MTTRAALELSMLILRQERDDDARLGSLHLLNESLSILFVWL